MSGICRKTARCKINAALLTLVKLHIPFRGPFRTRKQHYIYLVDGCILTESELVVLHQDDKLTAESIVKLSSDLRPLHGAKPY